MGSVEVWLYYIVLHVFGNALFPIYSGTVAPAYADIEPIGGGSAHQVILVCH